MSEQNETVEDEWVDTFGDLVLVDREMLDVLQALGVCAQTDPETFFPGKGMPFVAQAAKRICSTCPVQAECLGYALEYREPYGIWGGLTAKERQHLRASDAA